MRRTETSELRGPADEEQSEGDDKYGYGVGIDGITSSDVS